MFTTNNNDSANSTPEEFIRQNEQMLKQSEFCFSQSFDPQFVAGLMYHGFLPMCDSFGSRAMLLPKLHFRRCVLELGDATVSKTLNVGRRVRRAAKDFTFTVDAAFDDVIDGCRKQHRSSCWLHPPLANCLKAFVGDQQPPNRVRVHTFEVWDTDGKLVGGEIGYAIGGCYTSMSGFHSADNAGTVQCCVTGRLLERLGYDLWDLGMELAYKVALGASSVPRKTFVEMLSRVRDKKCGCLTRLEKQPALPVLVYDSVTPPTTTAIPITTTAPKSKLKLKSTKHDTTTATSTTTPPTTTTTTTTTTTSDSLTVNEV